MRFKKQKKICSALIITLTAAIVMPTGGAIVMPNTGQTPITAYADTGDPQSTLTPLAKATPGEEPPDEPAPTGDPNKAWIIEDFMGVADDDGSIEPQETGVPKLEKDNIIWLGIAFDNLEMFYPGLQMGISNMEIALNYDPKYIAPCSKAGKVFTDFSTAQDQEAFISDWLDYIAENNLKSGVTSADVQKWDADIYQFYEGSTPCTKVNLNKQATNNSEMTSDMQMMYLNIGRKPDIETADWRLKGLDASQNADTENEHTEPGRIEKKYMMMLPFKIMFNPETTPVDESKPYLKLSLGPQTFVMGFGDEGYSDTANDFAKITVPEVTDPNRYGAWENAEHTGGMRDGINLYTYLDFVKEINIFETTAIPDELLDISLGYELIPAADTPEGDDSEDSEEGEEPGVEDAPETEPTPQATFMPVTLNKEFDPPPDPPDGTNRHGTLSDPGYDKDRHTQGKTQTYYVEVPPEAEKLQLTLERSINDEFNTPEVWFSNDISDPYVDIYAQPELIDPINKVSMPIDAAMTDTGAYLYHNEDKDVLTLSDVDMTKNNGFCNVIKIIYKPPDQKKAIDYLIYIRKLVKPQINLNYGNSPFGLIMRDDENLPTPEDKEAAKEAFCVNNRFDDPGLTPKGGITNRTYNLYAWRQQTDAEHNMDRNDYALFTEYYRGFTDPGLTVTNSHNELQELSEENYVEREFEYYLLDRTQPTVAKMFQEAEGPKLYQDRLIGAEDEYKVTELLFQPVRTEILHIKYKYTDIMKTNEIVDGETVVHETPIEATADRPLIVIERVGDISVDTAVTAGDISLIKTMAKKPIPDEKLKGAEEAGAIFRYRVEDISNDLAVTAGDISLINTMGKKPLIEYYTKE